MSPDLLAILDGLAARLRTVQGLRTFSYLPDLVAPPCAIVQLPSDITYGIVWGGGKQTYTIPIMLLVGTGTDRTAHTHLAAYMSAAGPKSIKGAVDADYTLGGIVDEATIASVGGVARYSFGGTEYFGARFVASATA